MSIYDRLEDGHVDPRGAALQNGSEVSGADSARGILEGKLITLSIGASLVALLSSGILVTTEGFFEGRPAWLWKASVGVGTSCILTTCVSLVALKCLQRRSE